MATFRFRDSTTRPGPEVLASLADLTTAKVGDPRIFGSPSEVSNNHADPQAGEALRTGDPR